MNAIWTFFIMCALVGTTPALNRIANALERPPVCGQEKAK